MDPVTIAQFGVVAAVGVFAFFRFRKTAPETTPATTPAAPIGHTALQRVVDLVHQVQIPDAVKMELAQLILSRVFPAASPLLPIIQQQLQHLSAAAAAQPGAFVGPASQPAPPPLIQPHS